MKVSFLFLLIATTLTTEAQLVNTSFESNGNFDLTGWEHTSCANPVPSNNTPAGFGDWSVALPAATINFCEFEPASNSLHQSLPWIADGQEVTLSWWWKRNSPLEPAVVWFGVVYLGIFLPQQQASGTSADWVHEEFNLIATLAPGELAAIALGPGEDGSGSDTAWYDGVDAILFTGMRETELELAFRPNPATDRIWVDLNEAPTEVLVVDATGREQAVRTFHRSGRTLQVDLGSIPPGLCVMLLKTASGIRTLRFIKA